MATPTGSAGDRRYQSLLRLYSPDWRMQNGPAVLAALKEQHHATGRTRPTGADHASFAAAGLQQRLLQPRPFTIWTLATALLLATSTSAAAWYLSTVIWHPGLDTTQVGPFDNGMPAAVVPMVAGTAFALTRRDDAARACAALAGIATLIIAAIEPAMHWPGPGPQVIVFFTGLNLLAIRATATRATAALTLAVALALGATTWLYNLRSIVNYLAETTPWVQPVLLAALALTSAALLVGAWRTPTDRPATKAQPQHVLKNEHPAG